jgi:hypothetical protein
MKEHSNPSHCYAFLKDFQFSNNSIGLQLHRLLTELQPFCQLHPRASRKMDACYRKIIFANISDVIPESYLVNKYEQYGAGVSMGASRGESYLLQDHPPVNQMARIIFNVFNVLLIRQFAKINL